MRHRRRPRARCARKGRSHAKGHRGAAAHRALLFRPSLHTLGEVGDQRAGAWELACPSAAVSGKSKVTKATAAGRVAEREHSESPPLAQVPSWMMAGGPPCPVSQGRKLWRSSHGAEQQRGQGWARSSWHPPRQRFQGSGVHSYWSQPGAHPPLAHASQAR